MTTWKAVPTKPTLRMVKAYIDTLDDNMMKVSSGTGFSRVDSHREAYQAMLEESPEGPEVKETK